MSRACSGVVTSASSVSPSSVSVSLVSVSLALGGRGDFFVLGGDLSVPASSDATARQLRCNGLWVLRSRGDEAEGGSGSGSGGGAEPRAVEGGSGSGIEGGPEPCTDACADEDAAAVDADADDEDVVDAIPTLLGDGQGTKGELAPEQLFRVDTESLAIGALLRTNVLLFSSWR